MTEFSGKVAKVDIDGPAGTAEITTESGHVVSLTTFTLKVIVDHFQNQYDRSQFTFQTSNCKGCEQT